VVQPWQKWRGSDKQVAGYFELYSGLTFLTVKGAGRQQEHTPKSLGTRNGFALS
jgi:hypothetical protein